jgi:hypothetical protein
MRPQQSTPFRAGTDTAAVLDRLQKLRNLLPAFAQEAAAARREAPRLDLQNTNLHGTTQPPSNTELFHKRVS